MNFVLQILSTVDSQVNHYTFDGYHAIASMFSTTLTTLLVIYFAGLGWLVIRGLIPLTPMAIAWHMIKAAFVFAFALHWDYFSYFFQSVSLHGADRLVGAMLSGVGQNSDATTVTQELGMFWEAGSNVFTNVWRASGPDFLLGTIMGLLGFAAVTGVTAIALFYLLMSKIALSVLLVLAPIIFPLFLWKATRGIFNAWLQLIAQWAITPLFLYAFLGLFLRPLQSQVLSMAATPNGPNTAGIATFILLAVIVIAVFKQAGYLSRTLSRKIEVGDMGGSGESVPALAFKAITQKGV
jgi:type IV secretion system protein VirB6